MPSVVRIQGLHKIYKIYKMYKIKWKKILKKNICCLFFKLFPTQSAKCKEFNGNFYLYNLEFRSKLLKV